MKIIAKTLLASSLCLLMAVPAHAGRYHDDGRLVDRMERQHQRIENGVESGALTHKETRKLTKQQHKTLGKAVKFREDDALTNKERRILNKRLVKTSNRIWKFKHNDKERYTGRHAFRDTYRDANWKHGHHRQHKHQEHHEDNGRRVNWSSDGNAWSRYGFLFW